VIDRLDNLYRKLDYRFSNEALLEQALTHRSVGKLNNERLEFLGDSILSFVISTDLYKRFPEIDEGRLSRIRASLVKGETLAKIAAELSLGDFLHLGSGELKSGGFRRASILADALESIFGAVYLDSGIETIERLILRLFDARMAKLDPGMALKDPKTRLQEYLQAQQQPLPIYEVVEIRGKSHNQHFTVSCRVEILHDPVLAEGASRRKAEQQAAEEVLRKLNCD
jgi:ribonuclease-3